jgi:hypothetical protein
MTSQDSRFVKLKLGETNQGAAKYLVALRSTADYYGWTEQFEPWAPKVVEVVNGRSFGIDTGRRGKSQGGGGRRLKISRSPRRDVHEPGKTNVFKVSRNCGLLDLAELGHFTKVDWYWMESPNGGRPSRDDWERRYAGNTH